MTSGKPFVRHYSDQPAPQLHQIQSTSATTGSPLRWLDTPEIWDWMLDNKARVFQVAGLGPGDHIFSPFSFGPFLGFWLAFEAALRMGCLCFPGGGLSSVARLWHILDNQIDAVCCTPTYAIRLGEVARTENLDLGRSIVRAIFSGGEPGGSIPTVTSQIGALWPKARVYDHYGMTETGSIGYACPESQTILHVLEASYLAEVIDPQTAEPLQPGQVGELVVTNLGRLGSPVLRYRTGDLVRPLAPGLCSCGSSELALEGGILGRVDDMITIRGVNLYPMAVDHVIRAFDDVAEYYGGDPEEQGYV